MKQEQIVNYLLTKDPSDELVSGLEEGLIDSVTEKVINFVQNSKVDISTRLTGFQDFIYSRGSVRFPKQLIETEKRILASETKFTEIYNRPVAKVIGLETPLIELVSIIYDFFSLSNHKETFKNIDELDSIVSRLLKSKEERLQFRRYSKLDKIEKTLVEEPKERLRGIINPANLEEFAEIGKQIGSTSQALECITMLKEIHKNFDDKDILKINKLVHKLNKKLNMLFDVVESDPTMTKESVENIAQVIKIFANYLTGISMYFWYYTKTSEVIIKIGKFYK